MTLLIRAIVTGFGYKIGSELARYVSEQVGLARQRRAEAAAEDDDGMVPGMPKPDGKPDGDGSAQSRVVDVTWRAQPPS